jgi:hypothetical protein
MFRDFVEIGRRGAHLMSNGADVAASMREGLIELAANAFRAIRLKRKAVFQSGVWAGAEC